MTPHLNFSGLKQSRWYQFGLRFVIGGAVTVCTGLIARHWGPVIGGLFLSLPAIFPASATLIERHETEKKRKRGICCRRRGRKAAALDAAGAVLGACALVCFGFVGWWAFRNWSALAALFAASVVWLLVAVGLWWMRRRLRANMSAATPGSQ